VVIEKQFCGYLRTARTAPQLSSVLELRVNTVSGTAVTTSTTR
jgi:hypothetical protein